MDFLAAGALILVLAIAIAIASKHPLRWAREEWRAMLADSFAPQRPGITGGSLAEPHEDTASREELKAYDRVKAMDTKLRAYAKRMRRDGRHLIAGKRYIPFGTKPSEPPPTRSGKVLPIRKPTRFNRGD